MYMFVQNFIKLSAALDVSSCWQKRVVLLLKQYCRYFRGQ